MDDRSSKPMHLYGATIVSRPPLCHIDNGMVMRGDGVYGSVDGGGPGVASGSLVMPNCLHGDASTLPGANGSGLVVDPGMGMGDAEGHRFRAGCRLQPSLSGIQQRQQLPQQQQQQQAHNIGAATARSVGSASPKPIRRRMRMITSCLECRRRKLKCNKSNPCTNCLRFSRDCFYLGPKLDEASQLRLTEIKEKVGSLERQLERDVAKSGGRGYYPQRILADDVEEAHEEERDLEITPMVALDLTYEDDADGMDDIMDLGVQVGKMRLTEKIGGLNRPRISEEIQTGLSGGIPQRPFPGGVVPGVDNGPLGQPDLHPASASSDQSLPDFLRPSASYIPPTSGVFFGQVVQSPSLLTFLPSRPAGDRLLEHYFEAVHPVARCVHRPSLEAQYEAFWDEATAGYEPRASVQAVIFAAWFSAAVAFDEEVVTREFGFTKANLVENMKIGTEVALSKANFLRTTRVDTLQAFVMYMVPLCRDEVSRAHSVLVGAAVRMAECMGLNRDGSKAYNLNPVDTHIRRLIWHQLCFLDIRTCEAQGPKPAIRKEDYDTWLPDNVEEDQLILTNGTCPARPCEGWTSNLLPLIRFEINEMMRTLWADRRKLESHRTTLAPVLFKIETFRKRMLDSYDRLLDERVPLQRYAKLVMHLLLYRLHVMVLHPYYANTASPLPQRLRSVLLTSATVTVELATQLDTNPAFGPWRWYAGAYQQYQAALILATEVYYHPGHPEAGRIWACLDYVFGLEGESGMPVEEKGRRVLAEIMSKMGVYMSIRRMRAPTATASASPAKQAVKTEEDDVVVDGHDHENEDNDDDDDDDDDDAAAAVAAAAAVLARAGMEHAAIAPQDTVPIVRPSPLFEQQQQQQPPGVDYRDLPPAPPPPPPMMMMMMKQEPGAIPPPPPGGPTTYTAAAPSSSSSSSSSMSGPISLAGGGNGTPPAMQTRNRAHYHHLHQIQQLPPGPAPMTTGPSPPPPSLGPHGGGVATSNPNMMMAAMMAAAAAAAAAAAETTTTAVTTTTGGGNNSNNNHHHTTINDNVLWSLAPPPPPPLLSNHSSSNNAESIISPSSNSSPSDNSDMGSSVDGGGVLGGPRPGPAASCHYPPHHHHHHHHHRRRQAGGGGGGSTTTTPADGGGSSGNGGTGGGGGGGPASNGGGGGSNHLLDASGGDWSNYQEDDAINALFPYDPQTGGFAGFGHHPMTAATTATAAGSRINHNVGGGGGGGVWTTQQQR